MKQFFRQGWALAIFAVIFATIGISATTMAATKSPEEVVSAAHSWCLNNGAGELVSCENGYVGGYSGKQPPGCKAADTNVSSACKKGYAEGVKQKKIDTSNTKPSGNSTASAIKTFNDSNDAATKASAKTACDANGFNELDGKKSSSCQVGYFLGATKESNKCNDGSVADASACNQGYTWGKDGTPQAAKQNALDNGGRLMDEFKDKCTSTSDFNDNEARCKKIIQAMAPVCTAPKSRDASDLKEYVSSCKQAVADAGGTIADPAGTGTTCQGGPLGWILCPLIDYMTKGIQICASLIDGLMQVRFLAETGPSSQIEKAWRAFLSIANIMLVFAFLFIIFSQSTGAGLNNYGIKRMLPRLIIAAVLMNISFYICALAIDISNIVGASIMGFLVGSGNTISSSVSDATGGDVGLMASVGFSAVLVLLAVLFLSPVMLTLLMVFIMLIGRQVVLMCLVLASPLAFVAWLLPNTEQYFKKWYKLFLELLVLYPVVMLVFGASLFLANVIGGSKLFDGINLTPF